jgi:hypothetical protein
MPCWPPANYGHFSRGIEALQLFGDDLERSFFVEAA